MDGMKEASGVSRRQFLASAGAFLVAPPQGQIEDLCFLGPGELARRIRTGELSVRDVMEAHLARIEKVNPKVNAICTLVAERALDQARRMDASRPKALPPLYGLPVAIKDLVLTQGIRTTFGSRIFKDFVPDHDALHVVAEFLERYDFLVLPVSQVAPFPVEVRWVREIEGVRMKTYIDWMASCYAITVTGLPALSVPAGFTAEGLPIGLQIVGRHQRDFEVLQMAHAFEAVSRAGDRRPPIALS